MSCNSILATSVALILSVISSGIFAKNVMTNQAAEQLPTTTKPLTSTPVSPPLDKMHLNNSNAYALDMLRNFNQASGNNNLIFSPTSLQFLLAILGSASNNPALLKQLNFAWHEPSTINIDTINEQLTLRRQYIDNPLNSTHKSSFLTIANGLCHY